MAHVPSDCPLDTAARAAALADAAASFPGLGKVRAEDLCQLVALELGHAGILDAPQPLGGIHSMGLPAESILHILAGNTPLAGLQSVIRGLLLGSRNRAKLPSGGLPEIDAFRQQLPTALQERLEVSTTLPASWLPEADAVVVFGDDETLTAVHRRLRPEQDFVPHGHRVSIGIVFDNADDQAAERAARDIGLYDQLGCLSLHDIYVDESGALDARHFAASLAQAMASFEQSQPRSAIPPHKAAEITALRDSYRFRATNDPRVALWASDDTAWTVIYEDDPQFAVSPLHRVAFVKPLPNDLEEAVRLVRPYLGTVAAHPVEDAPIRDLARLGISRVCPMGSAQEPSPYWHPDGLPQLASLVRWMDIEAPHPPSDPPA